MLVQAGGSPTGMRFAADLADVIFTSHRTFESARSFYATIKTMAEEAGRPPEAIRVLPSMQPVVAASQAEADALLAELDALIPDDLAMSILETNLGGIDLSGYDPDGPLPAIPPTEGIQSTQRRLTDWAEQESFSIRQLARGQQQPLLRSLPSMKRPIRRLHQRLEARSSARFHTASVESGRRCSAP